ncbi:MAG: methyltransferase domain-containing protein [Ignavibacteriae bacterium]|nr:methyltransferase domain-containing protein [Ignavibacteriota bacterium]
MKLQCPVCASSRVDLFFEMNSIPVFCNVLHASREEALTTTRGDMRLGFCNECGHLFNYAFDPVLMEYTQTYENSLHFSPRFQKFAEQLAQELATRYDLHGKDIIEMGCGKGDFLKMICDLGENRGVGFDASFQPELVTNSNHERFKVIQDFYSSKYSHYHAHFIACRHVLEHIDTPNKFVGDVRMAVGDKHDAIIYFEVPNALWTLRDLGVWDLIYEHCSYYTANSLARVFAEGGFDVLRLQEQFGGQFLGIELALRNNKQIDNHAFDISMTELASLVKRFGENYKSKVEMWQGTFDKLHDEEKRIVTWGGGSKGVTFLNVMREFSNIEYMVDINPRKHGMFVAGAGQKVIGPDFLASYKPDAVIVMNPIYIDEIRAMLGSHGLQPELLVA